MRDIHCAAADGFAISSYLTLPPDLPVKKLAGVSVQTGIYRCAVSVAGPSDLPRMRCWMKADHLQLNVATGIDSGESRRTTMRA